MSPKELSYIEDTLSHLDEIHAICQSIQSEVESPELRQVTECVAREQKQIYNRMMELLRT